MGQSITLYSICKDTFVIFRVIILNSKLVRTIDIIFFFFLFLFLMFQLIHSSTFIMCSVYMDIFHISFYQFPHFTRDENKT